MNKVRIASEFDPTADLVLFEGDCLDLLPFVPDGFVKLVVTSPPYNLGKPYESRLDLDEYLSQQRRVIEECVRVLDDRVGVEIVPCHALHRQMSAGVSYGEQLVYDIERLKRHFPAVPVMVILVDVDVDRSR